mmetsp:Transcript_17738/g.46798  ORF Transcript_17738/g.46798 Transcript_17738/m.46798 type:complete len:208 (-) Transcript_17738:34-657(-)
MQQATTPQVSPMRSAILFFCATVYPGRTPSATPSRLCCAPPRQRGVSSTSPSSRRTLSCERCSRENGRLVLPCMQAATFDLKACLSSSDSALCVAFNVASPSVASLNLYRSARWTRASEVSSSRASPPTSEWTHSSTLLQCRTSASPSASAQRRRSRATGSSSRLNMCPANEWRARPRRSRPGAIWNVWDSWQGRSSRCEAVSRCAA